MITAIDAGCRRVNKGLRRTMPTFDYRLFGRYRFFALVIVLTSCGRDGGDAPRAMRLELPDGRLEITIQQRDSMRVPGSAGQLILSVGDITGGRVETRLSAPPMPDPMKATVMARDESHTFEFGDTRFLLTLLELDNALVGEDFARFEIAETGVPRAPKPLSESEKIDALLRAVTELQGATFVRNGKAYSAADAVAHMRRKLAYAGDRIETAEQFIEHLGSRSSQSGEPYLIRYDDGREIPSAEFFYEELGKLNAAARK